MEIRKLVFGPVLSRRLGWSLGLDLVPHKTCNLDCLYCEAGPTNYSTEQRRTYVDFSVLIDQIRSVKHEIDFLTLTGGGEPTLQLNLDQLIEQLKNSFPYPIALLTNSLLLRFAKVRAELKNIDILMPSLDAVSQAVFEKVNRPCFPVRIEEVLDGLVKFRRQFRGNIWLEILLCAGINDTPREIANFSEAIEEINPDKVQLNTVVRPPAYREKVNAISMDALLTIKRQLNNPLVEIIAAPPEKKSNNRVSRS
jgi:wyosine [tRNA(Phe)-imidazoG37] synthetase (radical SAM superfamily)